MEQLTQLNRVEVRGIIGNVRLTKISDTICAKVTVATNYAYKAKDSSCIIETTWHNVVAFEGKYIKGLDKLERGSKVSVTGRLKNNRFTGADGLEKSVLDVIASELTFIDSREPLECEM